MIVVVEENRIRGTVECVYQLNPSALTVEDEDGISVQIALMSICTSFTKCFADDNANPRKDMYMLTDGEFENFLKEINELAMKYISREQTEGCRPRQITLISSPTQ